MRLEINTPTLKYEINGVWDNDVFLVETVKRLDGKIDVVLVMDRVGARMTLATV